MMATTTRPEKPVGGSVDLVKRFDLYLWWVDQAARLTLGE